MNREQRIWEAAYGSMIALLFERLYQTHSSRTLDEMYAEAALVADQAVTLYHVRNPKKPKK